MLGYKPEQRCRRNLPSLDDAERDEFGSRGGAEKLLAELVKPVEQLRQSSG